LAALIVIPIGLCVVGVFLTGLKNSIARHNSAESGTQADRFASGSEWTVAHEVLGFYPGIPDWDAFEKMFP
jgi:hypothetical protein